MEPGDKKDEFISFEEKTCDVSYIHGTSPNTLAKNLLVTSNDLDSLYHIISPNLENSDISSLLEQRLNAKQDVNIVEQMFKIQIAVFCKNGPSSVDNEDLRNELMEIKQSVSEQFSNDLSKSIDVISKWSQNDQNKNKFLHFVLNSCE